MVNDGIFSSSDVTAANIGKISNHQSLLEEQRICELSELSADAVSYAFRMEKEGYGVYEILSIIAEGFLSQSETPHEPSLDENKMRLSAYLKMTSAYDKITFTELFYDMMKEAGHEISEGDFLKTVQGDSTFAYVKNSLADEAYDVFTQDFSDARVRYSKTLSDAARLVAVGEVGYALLPLEERGGARLSTVAELIFKEDLKINSVTPVFGYEGTADMKYALVSRGFNVPSVCTDDDRYLEIRLRADLSVPLSELFWAAESLGCTVYRVNTIVFDTDDGPVNYYSVVFKDEDKDFSSLLVYLTLFSGAYTPIGIYKNLE